MNLTFIVNYEVHWAEILRINNWELAVSGNQKTLGDWDEENTVVMQNDKFNSWAATVNASGFSFPLEYKYVIIDKNTGKVIAWESRANRFTHKVYSECGKIVFTDDELHFDLPLFRGAGVAIPVFSLRSAESSGIGEYHDLKKMIDWATLTGQKMIQTLPVNDTTLQRTKADTYPYNTLSVYALNPMYLRLQAIGTLRNKKKQASFDQQRETLNKPEEIDYEEVLRVKWDFFKLIYEQEKKTLQTNEQFKKFVSENNAWLLPYSVFCYLRDTHHTSDFKNWTVCRKYNQKEVRKYYSQHEEKINFYVFLQYHAHLQLSDVHEYAKSKGVLLKGDIPIGVSPCSVDVWQNPDLFNLNVQAGAPPDAFSVKGQNWGFPTYNWEKMAKDGYSWWKSRLEQMARYFDAYRIDHILGFFRIWQIPQEQKWGLLGQFNPAKPLSIQEIENAGIKFDEHKCLQPYITDKILTDYFGETAKDVKKIFLIKNADGTYSFKEKYNTQRKIAAYFTSPAPAACASVCNCPPSPCGEGSNKATESHNTNLGEVLQHLICQVLFVRDAVAPNRYHPRISCHNNDALQYFNDNEKKAYIKLYNDFFYEHHNEMWKDHALNKLPVLLTATSMLSCAEDLGMIPATVPEVLKELNLLSLEIQRMPKRLGDEFASLYFVPYMSVSTTSTHDMNPIRAWWEENPEKTQLFYNSMLFEQGVAPATCEPWIAEKIVCQHLQSPAMWVILPLQDWLAIDGKIRKTDPNTERINVPDNPKHVWNYRMHISLDELLQTQSLNEKITKLIRNERQ